MSVNISDGIPSTDLLFRHLSTCDSESERGAASIRIKEHTALLSRELIGDALTKYLQNEVYRRIFELIQPKNSPVQKLGAIAVINALADFHGADVNVKLTRFANYLRVLLPGSTPQITESAAAALGKLVQPGGALISDIVDFELKRALEWLQGERTEANRYAAALVLNELARSSPTLVSSNVSKVLDLIWILLRDAKASIRESGSLLLGTCLDLLLRQNKIHALDSWCQRLFDEAERGLSVVLKPDSLHGCLLVYQKLFESEYEFIFSRFDSAASSILNLRFHSNALIRRSVVRLMPILATSNPERFKVCCLKDCVNFLVQDLKTYGQSKAFQNESVADEFLALGRISQAVGFSISDFVDQIMDVIRCYLGQMVNCPSHAVPVLKCISMLVSASPYTLQPRIEKSLDLLFSSKLSDQLVDTLSDIARLMPKLLPQIQDGLLSVISEIMLQSQAKENAGVFRKVSEKNDDWQIILAFKSLASFDFKNVRLESFIGSRVAPFLHHPLPQVRSSAVNTCSQLMKLDSTNFDPLGFKFPTLTYTISAEKLKSIQITENVLNKLLAVGVGDIDASVRLSVFNSLDQTFDNHLAQEASLRIVFFAMKDESFSVREASIRTITRLSTKNPAFCLPLLRVHLAELIAELQCLKASLRIEDSLVILLHVIHAAPSLVDLYLTPIMDVVLPLMSNANAIIAGKAILLAGAISEAVTDALLPYIDSIFPIAIRMLKDHGSAVKREAALIGFGKICRNTGFVISPYAQYPSLMEDLIDVLSSEDVQSVRSETLKVIGILGAHDPYEQKKISSKKYSSASSFFFEGLNSSWEDYYPAVAVKVLSKILSDASLSRFHSVAVQSLMYMFESLGIVYVPFLGEIIPSFASMMKAAPATLLEFYFTNLSNLISIFGMHIDRHVGEIVSLIDSFWGSLESLNLTIVSVLETLATALGHDARKILARFFPRLISLLEPATSNDLLSFQRILRAIAAFKENLSDYLNLLIPKLLNIVERQSAPVAYSILSVQAMRTISRHCNLTGHFVEIYHPALRTLQRNSSPELSTAILDLMISLAHQMKSDFLIFAPKIMQIAEIHRIDTCALSEVLSVLIDDGEIVGGLPFDEVDDEKQAPIDVANQKVFVNPQRLKEAWDTTEKSTQDDWTEWMRRLNVELLKESPSHSLRSCATLAAIYNPLARDLFQPAFISCWTELNDEGREDLLQSLETVLRASNSTPEITQTLLNLIEFMDIDGKPMPFDIRNLSKYAMRCRSWAKALRYKELEFMHSPTSENVEILISFNNQLQQPDAAIGILQYAQGFLNLPLLPSWYEKLGRWQEALASYERQSISCPSSIEALLGRMRCLQHLSEWDTLSEICQVRWDDESTDVQKAMAPLAAASSWVLEDWEFMRKSVSLLKQDSPDGAFFRAILAVKEQDFDLADQFITLSRNMLDTELMILVSENYSRAYPVIVRMQMLSELEEVKEFHMRPDKRHHIRNTWVTRLKGCELSVDVWQRILRVRSLALDPKDEVEVWIRFANLCRKQGNFTLAHQTLNKLLTVPRPEAFGELELINNPPNVVYACLKHAWASSSNEQKEVIFEQLRQFTRVLQSKLRLDSFERVDEIIAADGDLKVIMKLFSRCCLKLGEWEMILEGEQNRESIQEIVRFFESATKCDKTWYKAWHLWASANFQAVLLHDAADAQDESVLLSFVIQSMTGFFQAISFSSANSLQNTLRLLTLWFKYGTHASVESAFKSGLGTVSLETWLQVIPQLIARLHSPNLRVRNLLQELLRTLGRDHPQALVWSLTVATKSPNPIRVAAASSILENMRSHSLSLVEEAISASEELIRVGISWYEAWHEGLVEASQLYYDRNDIPGMLATLETLHQSLDRGPETVMEVEFVNLFGVDLDRAFAMCQLYETTHNPRDISNAWNIYKQVFRQIRDKQSSMKSIEMENASPKLFRFNSLKLAVPGSYKTGEPTVTIESFCRTLEIFTSKQRPRKMSMLGSNGINYQFILKGNEDLRQDERVMQLFGLVNTLLGNDPETKKRQLNIEKYSVIPLSPSSGLIGWVPNCETLHGIITEYRHSRNILEDIEYQQMIQMAPFYDRLQLIQKIEVFEYAMSKTTGQDLFKFLWLKSKSSEEWLERRTTFARSLAVMSMVGYVMGLGDRHPKNIMIELVTGKVVHIDFGDCFEVAMLREQFPEKVPFRLTRIFVRGLGVSGVEGNFRLTSEHVMRVLRLNKDSLMAVLEAFVYDPLINWRILNPATVNDGPAIEDSMNEQPEVLNAHAVTVMTRISNKLTAAPTAASILWASSKQSTFPSQSSLLPELRSREPEWNPSTFFANAFQPSDFTAFQVGLN
ncbi:phosphatidylinositol kinase- protein kinase tor1 [Chytriomyces hyalinus]|nr:phosphatidylinositol kinase- protein kinase tor1 [Chytriomyces hyalinus]